MPGLASRLTLPPPPREESDRDCAVLLTHLVSFCTGVPAPEIVAGGRAPFPAAEARRLVLYLAHTGLGWPLSRVGAAFGRDRTTVGHACRRVEDRRDDPVFDRRVEELEACLRHAPTAPGSLA